jgi:hypothetical protein
VRTSGGGCRADQNDLLGPGRRHLPKQTIERAGSIA